jgi:cytochrome b subunit of formate dehydrogenase
MVKARSSRWQFSLAGLMLATAGVAMYCGFAGLFGYAAVFALVPLAWICWMIYRLLGALMEGGHRNNGPYDSGPI